MAKQALHPQGAASHPTEPDAPEPDATPPATPRAPSLAELVGFSEQGFPVIVVSGDEHALEVPTTVDLGPDDRGCTLLVTFVDGNPEQPMVTGRVQPPRPPLERNDPSPSTISASGPLRVEADGEIITIEAERELVLRCGKASLRLRKDGFVEVRGLDVVSRAERSNWIKGGSVALN